MKYLFSCFVFCLSAVFQPKSTLTGLIKEMIAKFEEELPLYSLSSSDAARQSELLSYIAKITEGGDVFMDSFLMFLQNTFTYCHYLMSQRNLHGLYFTNFLAMVCMHPCNSSKGSAGFVVLVFSFLLLSCLCIST